MDVTSLGKAPVVATSNFMRTFRFEELSCGKNAVVQDLFASNKTYDLVIGEFFFYQVGTTVLCPQNRAQCLSLLNTIRGTKIEQL